MLQFKNAPMTASSMKPFNLLFLTLSLWCSLASATNADSLFNSSNDIMAMPGLVAAISMGAGVLLTFFGYHFFHIALFGVGFGFGAIVVYELLLLVTSNAVILWVGFFVGGALIGYLATVFYKAGVFVTGAFAGAMFVSLLQTSFLYRLYPSHPDIIYIIMLVVFMTLGGFLALYLEKPALIVATSIIGSTGAIWGLGYFAGHYPTPNDLHELRRVNSVGQHYGTIEIPTEWWAYFVGTMALALVGMFFQFGAMGCCGRKGDSKKAKSNEYKSMA